MYKMLKVFHVGITAPTYSSESITKSFKDVFGDVLFFDWQFHRYNYGTEGMQDLLMIEAEKYKPDIIFLHFNHNSEALSIDNYKKLSELGFVVIYTEDVRDDNKWFETLLPIVGLCTFTNRSDVYHFISSSRFSNVAFLPVSYNDIWYKRQAPTLKNYGDIVFLGNNYVNTNLNFPKSLERQEMCEALKAEFGDRFQAYGNGQENPMLNPQEAVACYNNALIAIAQNNFDRIGYQSDRALNSMGCGCATIMQHYTGIDGDFPNMVGGKWKTIPELIELCHTYLETFWMRTQLAEYQYETVIKNHTWMNRAEKLKSIIKTINTAL